MTIDERDVLPHLSEGSVAERRAPFEFDPPTLSEPGHLRYGVDVHFNAQSEEIGAVALVFYGKDAAGTWHILGGASPETREALPAQKVDGNSQNEDPAEFPVQTIAIPRVDPEESSTEIVEGDALVVKLPSTTAKVPPDPTNTRFQIPSGSP